MKKITKITTWILSAICSLSLFACTQTSTSEPPSASNPAPEEPTDEVGFYDDGGKYDAIIDSAEYSWSDSDGLCDGVFSDGAVEKDYATFSSETLGDGSVVAYYSKISDVPQTSVLSGAQLLSDISVDESIRLGLKGSYEGDNVMQGLATDTFLKIENTGYKTLRLNLKPKCTAGEFEQADFLSFKLCIYNESTNENESNTVTVYFKNRPLLRVFRCGWYEVKVPLAFWLDTGDKAVYSDKEALYRSLNDEAVSGDRSKGLCLQIVAPKSNGSSANDYVAYISNVKLGVDEIDETLGRDFANLTQTREFTMNKKVCSTNTWVYWSDTEIVRRADECDVSRQLVKYAMPQDDGMNVAVVPAKSLRQIQKYDYLYITMYIETENPFPLQVGINGRYNVTSKSVEPLLSGMDQRGVLVSANKWITYKIPIRGYLEKFYGRLQVNRVYTDANLPRVYYQNAMPLFFVNGEFANKEEAETKTETYGMNVYVSRIFLVKE